MRDENGKYENGKYKNKKSYPNKYIKQFFELLKTLPPDIEFAPLSVKSTDNPYSWQNVGQRHLSRGKLFFQQWTKTAREQWTEEMHEQWANAVRDQWTGAARLSLYEQLEELPTEFQDYIWGDAKYNFAIDSKFQNFHIDFELSMERADDKFYVERVGEVFDNVEYPPEIRVALSKYTVEAIDKDFDIKKQWQPTLEAVIRYEDFSSLLFYLRNIVKFIGNDLSAERQTLLTQTQMLPSIEQTRFQLNKHNKIEIRPDKFGLTLEGIDITRLRQCGRRNCQRLFWAGRADQKCCSPKCRETWKKQHQRDKLKNDSFAINEERREIELVRTLYKARIAREQANKRP